MTSLISSVLAIAEGTHEPDEFPREGVSLLSLYHRGSAQSVELFTIFFFFFFQSFLLVFLVFILRNNSRS